MTTNENDLANTGEERADAPEDAPPIADATEAVVEKATEVTETAAAEELVAEVEEEPIAEAVVAGKRWPPSSATSLSTIVNRSMPSKHR